MKDLVLVTCVVLAFATLVTSHLAIVFGLTVRAPRWRGLVALIAPPLGPYWAWREHLKLRTLVWMASLALYAVARIAASF